MRFVWVAAVLLGGCAVDRSVTCELTDIHELESPVVDIASQGDTVLVGISEPVPGEEFFVYSLQRLGGSNERMSVGTTPSPTLRTSWARDPSGAIHGQFVGRPDFADPTAFRAARMLYHVTLTADDGLSTQLVNVNVELRDRAMGSLLYGSVRRRSGTYDQELGWVGVVSGRPNGCVGDAPVRAGLLVDHNWTALELDAMGPCSDVWATTPAVVATSSGLGLFYRPDDSRTPLRYGLVSRSSGPVRVQRVGATPDRHGFSRDMDVRSAVVSGGRRVLFAEDNAEARGCFRLRMMDANGDHACPTRWTLDCESDESVITDYAELASTDHGAAVVWGERNRDAFDPVDRRFRQSVRFAMLNGDGQRVSNIVELARWESDDVGLGTVVPSVLPFLDADGDQIWVAWNDGAPGRAPAYAARVECAPR